MANKTYKTVIANAIKGFNDIQNKIYENSGGLVAVSTTASSVTTAKSVSDIVGALNAGNVSLAAATVNKTSVGTISISAVAPASGETYTLGTGAYTIEASSETSGSHYYIKIASNAPSSTVTITSKYTTGRGLIKTNSTGVTGTNNVTISAAGSGNKYIKIPKATFTTSGSAVSVATAGYIASGNVGTVSAGSLSTATSSTTGYATLTTPSVPASGYLLINAGYYGNSQISLATLIPDNSSVADATADFILSGYEAFNTAGARIVGNIPTITPTHTASADTSYKPSISKTDTTNVLASAATTTKPGSGHYVTVQSSNSSKTITTSAVVAKGYNATAVDSRIVRTVTINASDPTYIPITDATVTKAATSSKTAHGGSTGTATATTSYTYSGIETVTSSDYWFSVTANSSANASASAYASVSASASVTVTAGYTDGANTATGTITSTTSFSTSTGVKSASSNAKIFIKAATTNKKGGKTSAASTSATVSATPDTNITATTSSGGYYYNVTISATATASANASASAEASVSSGYSNGVSSSTNASASSSTASSISTSSGIRIKGAVLSIDNPGDFSFTPAISDTASNVSITAWSATKPDSGYYVGVQTDTYSASKTHTATVTAGYTTGTFKQDTTSASVGRGVKYAKITGTSLSLNDPGNITLSTTLSNVNTNVVVSGTAASKPGDGFYVGIQTGAPSGTVTHTASVGTGYIAATSKQDATTASFTKQTLYTKIQAATVNNTAKASSGATKTSDGNATSSATYKVTSMTYATAVNTANGFKDYYVVVTANASASAYAAATASSAASSTGIVGEGYTTGLSSSSSVSSATGAAITKNTSTATNATVYIRAATLSASSGKKATSATSTAGGVSAVSSATSNMSTTTTANISGYNTFYVAITSVASASAKATASATASASAIVSVSAGYTPDSSTNASAVTGVVVTANYPAASQNANKTIYIKSAELTIDNPGDFSFTPTISDTASNVSITEWVATKPTSGYYVGVQTDTTSTSKTHTATVTAGYTSGTFKQDTTSLSVGRGVKYAKITSAALSLNNPGDITLSTTLSNVNTNVVISGTAASQPSDGFYVGIQTGAPSGSKTHTASVSTGYISTTSKTDTTTASFTKQTLYTKIKAATTSNGGNAASGSSSTATVSAAIATNDFASAATTSSGGYRFAVTVSATAKGSANASASASASVTDGYSTGVSASKTTSSSTASATNTATTVDIRLRGAALSIDDPGNDSYTPTLSNTATNVSTGTWVATKPGSGYYVGVQSSGTTKTITTSATVTAGYTTTKGVSDSHTTTIGSRTIYAPITAATLNKSSSNTASAGGSTAGGATAVASAAASTNMSTTTTANITGYTTYYVAATAVASSSAKAVASASASAAASVTITEGYITASNAATSSGTSISKTSEYSSGSKTANKVVYIKSAGTSAAGGKTSSASTKASASISSTTTNMTATTTNGGYFFTANVTASATASANASASASASVTEGYSAGIGSSTSTSSSTASNISTATSATIRLKAAALNITNPGDDEYTPTLSNTATNVSTGTWVATKPTSGYYVGVQSSGTTKTITTTATVTAGYTDAKGVSDAHTTSIKTAVIYAPIPASTMGTSNAGTN